MENENKNELINSSNENTNIKDKQKKNVLVLIGSIIGMVQSSLSILGGIFTIFLSSFIINELPNIDTDTIDTNIIANGNLYIKILMGISYSFIIISGLVGLGLSLGSYFVGNKNWITQLVLGIILILSGLLISGILIIIGSTQIKKQ